MSPSLIYIFLWLSIILLQALKLLDFYSSPSRDFIIIQIYISILVLVSELFFRSLRYKNNFININDAYQTLEIMLRKFSVILIMIFILEVIYSKGVPALWIFSNALKTHADFGIPTIHGAFHGFLLFYTNISFYLYLSKINRKVNFSRVLMLFIYASLVFNRGIVIIVLIQFLFLYILVRKENILSIKFLILTPVGSLLFLWIFGRLGNIRHGFNVFSNSISEGSLYLFEWLPLEYLWSYSYITGGLNNLYYNIESINPDFIPDHTLSKLVPTAVYKLLDIEKNIDTFTLADPRITVSTAFQGPISDFGIIGILYIVPVIMTAQFMLKRALYGCSFSTIFYSILMQSILLTPYIDTLLYLPFLLQVVLLVLAYLIIQKNMLLKFNIKTNV